MPAGYVGPIPTRHSKARPGLVARLRTHWNAHVRAVKPTRTSASR